MHDVHRGTVHDRRHPRAVRIVARGAHHRAAAPETLRIDLGFLRGGAGLGERADDAAGDSAGRRACERRDKPAGCDDRASPGIAIRPRPVERANGPADRGANARTGTRCLGAVVRPSKSLSG